MPARVTKSTKSAKATQPAKTAKATKTVSRRQSAKPAAPVYQLKITLLDTHPPIWRRVLVAGDISLAELHQLVQTVMGWTNSHLHQFMIGAERYSAVSQFDGYEPEDERDEAQYALQVVAPRPRMLIRYDYDFGDNWEHLIQVEKILKPVADRELPQVLAGKRAGPPEDCGGVWGYAALLEALADPEHEDHAELLEWVGDDFDPEYFSLLEVNAALHPKRRTWLPNRK